MEVGRPSIGPDQSHYSLFLESRILIPCTPVEVFQDVFSLLRFLPFYMLLSIAVPWPPLLRLVASRPIA